MRAFVEALSKSIRRLGHVLSISGQILILLFAMYSLLFFILCNLDKLFHLISLFFLSQTCSISFSLAYILKLGTR